MENPAADLQRRLSRIYDHLYANAALRTPEGIGAEVGKVLHAAQFSELHGYGTPAFAFSRSEEKDLCKAASTGLFTKSITEQVRKWFQQMNQDWNLYSTDAEIQLEDADIRFIARELNGIAVSSAQRDVLGDAVEVFRSSWVKRTGGQFFTDQHVTTLAMTLLQFDPYEGDDLVDICAGTGGFLLAALERMTGQLATKTTVVPEVELTSLASRRLLGVEVDKSVAAVANASLILRLGNLDQFPIECGDSLRIFDRENGGKNSRIQLGSHLCAATNPPFGSKTTIKDPRLLGNFDLARAPRSGWGGVEATTRLSPKPPEVLFIEQNLKLLVPGKGRLAIVVPYQILSGPQSHYVRDWLVRNAEILAVVDLPPETFQPHTGTKAALLVVKRRLLPLDRNDLAIEDGPIFMAVPRWIGHDRRGNPVYRRGPDGKITSDVLTDLHEVGAAYERFLEGRLPHEIHEQSFSVLSSEIIQEPTLRLNATYYQRSGRELSEKAAEVSGHSTIKLGDVVTRVFFPGRFRRDYVDKGESSVPFLGGTNISQWIVSTDKHLSSGDSKIDELRVHTGWILVTRSGTTGVVATVPPAWDGVAISEHVIRIEPDPSKLDPGFLAAYLKSQPVQEYLRRGVFGSVIDEIEPSLLEKLPIPSLPADSVKTIAMHMKEAETARQISIASHDAALRELTRMLE